MTSASFDTSPATTVTFGEPISRQAAATPSSSSPERAVSTSDAPALANPWANPSPNPYDAPVMSTVLPVKSMCGSLPLETRPRPRATNPRAVAWWQSSPSPPVGARRTGRIAGASVRS
eukprot:gene20569-40382_t